MENIGEEKAADSGLGSYHHTYTYLGLRGWEDASDANLSIDYVNEKLEDIPDKPVKSRNADCEKSVKSEVTDSEESTPSEEPKPEEEYAFYDPNYGLWMLEDGEFHHNQVTLTKADLQRIAEDIRNGKTPMTPVWTNSKAE